MQWAVPTPLDFVESLNVRTERCLLFDVGNRCTWTVSFVLYGMADFAQTNK